jgi:hypothetical protein
MLLRAACKPKCNYVSRKHLKFQKIGNSFKAAIDRQKIIHLHDRIKRHKNKILDAHV